jgi:hypothetical protein
MNYAYLHGFAADSDSEKGRRLAERFADWGVDLHRPDLNVPSFEELTYTGMVEAVDRMTAEVGGEEPWRFVGSSMGGFIAARWAARHPERVDRLVLLCPGFNMVERWAEILGQERVAEWEEEGHFLFFDPSDSLTAVHWELYADARDNHPSYPQVECPVVVFHGAEDEIVPLASSERYVDGRDDRELVVVADNHTLHESVDAIAARAGRFFGLTGQ